MKALCLQAAEGNGACRMNACNVCRIMPDARMKRLEKALGYSAFGYSALDKGGIMSDKKPLIPDAIFHIEDDDDLLNSVAKTVRRAGVIAGIVELVLGVVMLFWPSKTLTAVTVLLGIGLVVFAVIYLVASVETPILPPGWRTMGIVCSVLFVLGAIAILKAPQAVGASLAVLVTIVLGMLWIVDGITSLFQASFTLTPVASVVYGIVSILAGIVVLAAPSQSTVFLFMFVAIALIVLGIVSIVRALTFGRK